MNTLAIRSLTAAAVCLAVLLAAMPARAGDGAVTVGVGHSWTKSFGKTPFESTPKISVDKPAIASVSWRGEESGTLVITVAPGGTHVIKDLPGFCPDFEKDPPQKDDEGVYACKQPDEKAKVLLDTIALAKKLDVGSLKLKVFGKDKARSMVAQGALWMVDSKVDDTKGNEVAAKDLSDKFFGSFAESAKASLEKMPPASRKKAEKLVQDDIRKIVAATSFIAKKAPARKAKPTPT